jgi:hypothetical protein
LRIPKLVYEIQSHVRKPFNPLMKMALTVILITLAKPVNKGLLRDGYRQRAQSFASYPPPLDQVVSKTGGLKNKRIFEFLNDY